MKKIIHMSDLHIGYKNLAERFNAVVDSLCAAIDNKTSDYVVVITGDLVNDATLSHGYEEAHKGCDRLRECGFKDILVVPGNHDYGTGNLGNKKFVQFFKETFFDRPVHYPKVDIIEDVAFIGLDSMAKEIEWYNKFWAQGRLGSAQLAALKAILESDAVRVCAKRVIYLHHHPFDWRPFHSLKDARALKKILDGAMTSGVSIDAILFGHNHEGNAHNGEWNIERAYDAGTATLKMRPVFMRWVKWFQVRSAIRIIDLEKSPDSDTVFSFKQLH
jgi:3',5'-cyclic AMP phosphodiesterase CpdA